MFDFKVENIKKVEVIGLLVNLDLVNYPVKNISICFNYNNPEVDILLFNSFLYDFIDKYNLHEYTKLGNRTIYLPNNI